MQPFALLLVLVQLFYMNQALTGNEWLYLKECLDSTFVSSVGKFVDRFDADLAAFTGAKHAVAVVNGTAALHIALKLAGVNFCDEVLIPSLTFVATANAVTYCGASPHFVDSEECTLGIDAEKLRDYLKCSTEQHAGQCVNRTTGRIIRAVVPMHTFGHPADVEGLLAVATDYNLALVEDAAESLGSYYHGQHTGTFGLMGTLSFNGNKTITTGGGGAILTDDAELARHAKHLTTTAKLPHAKHQCCLGLCAVGAITNNACCKKGAVSALPSGICNCSWYQADGGTSTMSKQLLAANSCA